MKIPNKLEIKLKEIITEDVEEQIYNILGNRIRELHADIDHELDGVIKQTSEKVYKAVKTELERLNPTQKESDAYQEGFDKGRLHETLLQKRPIPETNISDTTTQKEEE